MFNTRFPNSQRQLPWISRSGTFLEDDFQDSVYASESSLLVMHEPTWEIFIILCVKNDTTQALQTQDLHGGHIATRKVGLCQDNTGKL